MTYIDRDIKTIGKHVNNAIEEELEDIPTVAKLRQFKMKAKGLLKEMLNITISTSSSLLATV